MGESAEDTWSDEARALDGMRAASDALWGADRSRANGAVLARTARAVHRMSRLASRPEETPGFFLAEFADEAPGSALGLGRSGD